MKKLSDKLLFLILDIIVFILLLIFLTLVFLSIIHMHHLYISEGVR